MYKGWWEKVNTKSEKELVLYICDDEMIWQQKIRKICESVFGEKWTECTIVHGKSGKEVLAYQGEIDILILDIDMPGIDGIQVKNQMQKKNRNTNIIFVTNYSERMREAFGPWVFAFVDKGDIEKDLKRILPELIERICRYVKIDRLYDSREVLYLQAEGSYTDLYFRSGERHTIRKNLKELEKELVGVDFIRTHRSYLVNMHEITGKITDTVSVGQQNIPVSVRLRKKVKEAYRIFCRKNAGY